MIKLFLVLFPAIAFSQEIKIPDFGDVEDINPIAVKNCMMELQLSNQVYSNGKITENVVSFGLDDGLLIAKEKGLFFVDLDEVHDEFKNKKGRFCGAVVRQENVSQPLIQGMSYLYNCAKNGYCLRGVQMSPQENCQKSVPIVAQKIEVSGAYKFVANELAQYLTAAKHSKNQSAFRKIVQGKNCSQITTNQNYKNYIKGLSPKDQSRPAVIPVNKRIN